MAEPNKSGSTASKSTEESESESGEKENKAKKSPKQTEFGCMCCVCEPNLLYETQQELQRHVRNLHPDADIVFACWECNREFHKFYRLIRHVSQGHMEDPLSEPTVAGAATDRPLPVPKIKVPQKINKENGEPLQPWEEEHVIYALARQR